ncbi:ABC transporter substrate-binding protein [Paenisporosarcina sp. TG20]|uniref:ABC transporter substrate-binding protein n=1 Tax=Paenisporosarcina sp. TG20 TaxID=1211706 RepID=UPI0002EDD85E|nr:ABC transporter substrate-binding protein [Paenisporosarcina sp. TG20]
MKNILGKVAVLFFSTALILAGCSEGGENKATGETGETKKYKIGVTQIVEHPSLNAAFDGFKEALEVEGLEVEYIVENAQNDNSANTTIATNLVNSGVDLIFANSTPSAQAVASATQTIPIVFTSVTDAVSAELVDSMESPGGNLTGTIDLHPDVIKNTLTFLKEELGAKNVGIIFNSGEQNSRVQMDKVNELKDELGLNIVEASVATSAEVKQAAESLIGKVDSLYIIKDNTVVSALESVVLVARNNKLPMMVGELDSVKRGGLAAFGFEYFDLGYEAGLMAVKILKEGNKPSDLPVQVPKELRFVMNKETIEAIELKVKDEWKAEFSE